MNYQFGTLMITVYFFFFYFDVNVPTLAWILMLHIFLLLLVLFCCVNVCQACQRLWIVVVVVHACFLCTVAKPFTWFVLELNSRFQSAYCIPCEFEADMLYISLLSTFKISLCKLRYYQLMKRICPGQARTGDPQCGGRQELRRIHEV